MSVEEKVKRITFKEGELVLGHEEKLRFGNRGSFAPPRMFLHSVNLEDLKKIQEFLYPLRFKKVNNLTEAKRTVTGGMKIRILDPYTKNACCQQYCELGRFSRREFNIIKQYL
jgi:hypothetical protein